MPTIRDPLKCGGCGEELHRLFNRRDPEEEGRDEIGRLEIECIKCGAVSWLNAWTTQRLVDLNGKGTLCGGWYK